MERELLTRNFMTGWVFIAAFLSAWLPTQGLTIKQASDCFAKSSALVPLIVAVLGSPIIGYVISSFVLVYMYVRFGHPYNFYSRVMAESLVKDKYPQLCDSSGATVCPGRHILAYLAYSRGPNELAEWGRRQHTTRFIGYNWTIASVLGLVLGSTLAPWCLLLFIIALLVSGIVEHYAVPILRIVRRKLQGRLDESSNGERASAFAVLRPYYRWLCHQLDHISDSDPPSIRAMRYQPWSLVAAAAMAMGCSVWVSWLSSSTHVPEITVAVVSAAMLFLAFAASWDVEEVERLWVDDYLREKLSLRECPGAERRELPGA